MFSKARCDGTGQSALRVSSPNGDRRVAVEVSAPSKGEVSGIVGANVGEYDRVVVRYVRSVVNPPEIGCYLELCQCLDGRLRHALQLLRFRGDREAQPQRYRPRTAITA